MSTPGLPTAAAGEADDALRMAIVDKVQRIEELQADELAARRRTARNAWLLVLAAGVVLAVIVASLGWKIAQKRTELAALEVQQREAGARVEAATAQVEALEKRVAELRQREQALNSVLSQLPKAQLESVVGTSVDGKAAPAQWLPRAYLHIVDPEDRAWANGVAAKLRAQGWIVPGIELVPAARGLRRTDVRYYRKADRDAAQRIVERLDAMGIPAVLNYLEQYENSDRVKPNNYEIWFVAGSRELPLR